MADSARWGILGLGRIAEAFAEGLSNTPNARLVACGSRSAGKSRAFGAKWEVQNCHSSWDALAADPEIDAIYIATPHVFHRENALLCLSQGKAVLCEKPFTINSSEAKELISEAKTRQLLLMEGMWTRFLPHIALLRKLIADGAIGEISFLQADFGFRCEEGPEGRIFNPELGGGALLDVGVYLVSLAHMLLGAPLETKAISKIGQTGVDEETSILMRHKNGALSSLSCSVIAATPQEGVVVGSKGRIKLLNPWWGGRSPGLILTREDGKEEHLTPEKHGNGYNYEAGEFSRCLLSGLKESQTMPLDETVSVMSALDEIRRQIGLRYPKEERGA